MNTADMAEELAHRQADRWGNRPLTRGPDPDRVARHLAVAEGPTMSKMSLNRRNELTEAFRRAAAVSDQAKAECRAYLQGQGRTLMTLVETTDPKVFEAAEAWIARYVPPVDTMTPPAERDGFTHESPIRAFTDFQASGLYAIGKGFRPSLSHLATYLDAMHQREGWKLVQVILPDNDAGDPAILFIKVAPVLELTDVPPPDDVYARVAASVFPEAES